MSQGSLLPNAADFRPDVKSLGPGSSVLSGSDMIAAEVEQVIDLIVGGEEALRLAGRFKLLHFAALVGVSVGVNFRLGCSVPCAGDAQCRA
jgi:hypothetical protein